MSLTNEQMIGMYANMKKIRMFEEQVAELFAAGKIPGGFFKREGRPSEREILISRFIDRPLRPLFPKNFHNDVQIIATVLSADDENDPDVVAISAASAALEISDIPFSGPIAGARVGRINGEFVVNPPISKLQDSDCDIVIAGSQEALVMVEGSAQCISEQVLLDAIIFGHHSIQDLINAQKELRSRLGKKKMEVPDQIIDLEIEQKVRRIAEDPMRTALAVQGKQNRNNAIHEVFTSVMEELLTQYEDGEEHIRAAIENIEKQIIRDQIINEGKRIDGRTPKEIRPISCDVAVLPRTHGSGLFTRGET